MKKYIFMITYNFSGDYIIKKCDTYKDALAMLQLYLKEESKNVQNESNYIPSVLEWDKDDITLVYAEGYVLDKEEREKRNHATEDCAYYRIFEM